MSIRCGYGEGVPIPQCSNWAVGEPICGHFSQRVLWWSDGAYACPPLLANGSG